MPPRRSFPSPWSIVEISGGYRVDDASGKRLCYFYSWDDPTAAYQADVLTGDEARRMAEDFTSLSERQRPSRAPTLSPDGLARSADQGGGDNDNRE
jgi:hypothetical protein